MTVEILTSSQTWTAPSNIVSPMSVELIAAGGGGGTGGASSGGGGGGGAYAKANSVAVVGGVGYPVTLPAGAAAGVDGSDAVWDAGAACLAKGGTKGAEGAGGTGGPASGCVGDTKRDGGSGDFHAMANVGGGGGGSAGSAAAGNSASANTGGAAVTDGGAGGDGESLGPGAAGGSPGGGGAGGGGPAQVGSAGGNSWCRLTYTLDTVASISSITGPSSATYVSGQNLDFTVTFTETVTVTGSPYIALTIGATSRNATYLSGTGSNTLIFRYTTVASDSDADGIASASPIQLNGGTIQDSLPQAATLTFTPPDTSGVLVQADAMGGVLNNVMHVGWRRGNRR